MIKYTIRGKSMKLDFFKIYVIALLVFVFLGPVVFLYLGTHEQYSDLFIKSVAMGTIVFFGSMLVLIIYSFIFNKKNRNK